MNKKDTRTIKSAFPDFKWEFMTYDGLSDAIGESLQWRIYISYLCGENYILTLTRAKRFRNVFISPYKKTLKECINSLNHFLSGIEKCRGKIK